MQVEPDHVVCARLILRQPSLAWLTFSLEDIKIFPHTEPVSLSNVVINMQRSQECRKVK